MVLDLRQELKSNVRKPPVSVSCVMTEGVITVVNLNEEDEERESFYTGMVGQAYA